MQVKQLGVRVVKGAELGGGATPAWVVLEVDEPGQQFQTRPVIGPDPAWDQAFTVNLTQQTTDLLFEVWQSC